MVDPSNGTKARCAARASGVTEGKWSPDEAICGVAVISTSGCGTGSCARLVWISRPSVRPSRPPPGPLPTSCRVVSESREDWTPPGCKPTVDAAGCSPPGGWARGGMGCGGLCGEALAAIVATCIDIGDEYHRLASAPLPSSPPARPHSLPALPLPLLPLACPSPHARHSLAVASLPLNVHAVHSQHAVTSSCCCGCWCAPCCSA